uniref:DNA helicase MCM8 n=1 Tax=Timema poppense TaxID=170557 RepID=A0A7R9CNH8_TIMPO|nr:unnamed protein product [Timema poppensis]
MNRGGRGGFRNRGRTSNPWRNNWFRSKNHKGVGPCSNAQNSQSSQLHIPELSQTFLYRGWKLYFPQEPCQDGSSTVRKVEAIEQFIAGSKKLYSHTDIEERRAFTLNLKTLTNDEVFKVMWPNLLEDLTDNPETTLNCMSLAMHQMVSTALENEVKLQLQDGDDIPPIKLPIIRARPTNFEPVTELKNLKASYYGKLVSVRGTIIRVGNVKILCTWMAFLCNSCRAMQCIKQPEGIFTEPTSCSNDDCRSRTFSPLISSPYTQTVNWQSVRLQELVADDRREGGRIPRTIECELMEDLLNSCVPGDVVTITGIVKVRNSEETTNKKAPSMFVMYIEVVSLVNNKTNSASGKGFGAIVEFNIKDYYAIQQIHSEPNIFRLLVNSLCPLIYGHEMVKAGLLLALFGGSMREDGGRADPHVLVVGDPGLGKSQMLQACSSVAPRGVYVCGNTSTASGLTVTLTREGGGNYSLEAGALVLADQGCCCIDEFDKMSNQHSALLEAMEQQSISIAKASVVCSLPARTSVLAAANPVGGHYDRGKTVSENLRLGSALLSRFDLVFILLDRPNEHLDSLLSEHVMALHSGLKHNPEAAAVLQQFYLDLRRQHQSLDSTPITTRQLESLVRLVEARAKLELREEITETDALDVVEVMKYSLVDTLSDEFGHLDFNRSQHGSGISTKNQAKTFIAALQRRADGQSRSVFSVQEMKEVANMAGVQVTDFFSFLSALNVQGFLLKKGPNLYQLLTVDY